MVSLGNQPMLDIQKDDSADMYVVSIPPTPLILKSLDGTNLG